MNRIKEGRLAIEIAFTHMRAKLKQTLVATAGVAFGITVFIFMVSFIKGTNNYVQDVAFEQSAHLRLFNESKIAETTHLDTRFPQDINHVHHLRPKERPANLKDGTKVVAELREDERILAVSGTITTQVFYRLGPISINGIVNGIVFEDENQLFGLENKLIAGSFNELSTQPNSMVIGSTLAKNMNVALGDKITITTENGRNFLVTIIGLIKTGISEIDQKQSYVSLKTAQGFMGVPSTFITDIKIKIHEMEEAPDLLKKFQKRYDYQGSDWKTDNAALLEGDILRNMIVYGVAGTILLVAGFGIFNILTMMIYEKMKDIAILKAMGFSDVDVRWIFLTQAVVIGVIGSILGLAFGFLLSYATSKAPFESDVIVTMDHLPMSFDPVYYISGITFGILTTSLSGFLPSRKAAKLDPISILRG
ncbi:ABC transporter permease [Negadavirga shengliensis]|uniref:ABC transporter permease n=1 Tax=Negadavirga shengliensis TaxID=1389218 RepID=A0ABV9T408_9BACT